MLDQQSNKSSVSSCPSSPDQDSDNIPNLVEEGERLPTFAKAALAQLPHVVIPEQDPPSFRISAALQENDQEFPPVSPRTAEILLHTHPDIASLMKQSTLSPMDSSPPYTTTPWPPAKSSMPVAPGSNNSAINSLPVASKSPASKDDWGPLTSPPDLNRTLETWPTPSPSVLVNESSHNLSGGWALGRSRCSPDMKETSRYTSPSLSSPLTAPYPWLNPYRSGSLTSSRPQGTSSTP